MLKSAKACPVMGKGLPLYTIPTLPLTSSANKHKLSTVAFHEQNRLLCMQHFDVFLLKRRVATQSDACTLNIPENYCQL